VETFGDRARRTRRLSSSTRPAFRHGPRHRGSPLVNSIPENAALCSAVRSRRCCREPERIRDRRKALLIISTGIDTFSHANFEDLVKKAEAANTPVYVIGLGDTVRKSAIDRASGPRARVDWETCERQLERLAHVSGGRVP
jgi:hypothetical protein